jgi:hypothetical protein
MWIEGLNSVEQQTPVGIQKAVEVYLTGQVSSHYTSDYLGR